ncbi:DsbA family protein [Pediococcus claussenii]|uniref:Dithiol-disulfide isomerase n=1 Tax=Pediococcus claussenii (strain ATCC BAA-344 / DSM 14800 / JCM 18046 / KCTC 3811 / LMG 21948 / P06) TaxID=701521 RepID=G8PCS5_PEDCP|nr:DsbA family protein [Pediococcus claussenii]AEV95060.1 dithiol-disulfide isomerase [Pediococcus claussenii ATCC BAA-344]ANZ70248.1 dithiol-disulfide isomerase [Pediococcus claussenii]ANZ72064.1 dithiol-disulfide isomerase [Pediococcus claussenii]KRN18921.1 hypothetical protein IV79_GL001764 [Pediococcus claussenii]
MLEAYLYVTPWGEHCFNCEKETLDYFQHTQEKVDFKIIPVLNIKIVREYIETHNQPGRSRSEGDYNLLFSQMYHTTLDYKAACYQGKQRGKKFLYALQTAMIKRKDFYTKTLGTEVASMVGLDLEMFELDRDSNMAKREFKKDQELAQEMGVTVEPSAVVFNAPGEDCGILLEQYDRSTLEAVCQLDIVHPHPISNFNPHII